MAIYFRTGRPGSAKTLSTIEEVLNAQKRAEEKGKPRKVYYSNIIRFDETHPKFTEVKDWIPLSFAQILEIYVPESRLLAGDTVLSLDWFENNSILLIDEAQLLYPVASPFSKKHPHLTWLSHHRHSGLDIYYCAPDESDVHNFFRSKVKYHKHLTQLGSQLRSNFKQSSDGVLSKADPVTIDGGTYAFNKDFFGLYESSTDHVDNKSFFENLRSLPLKIKAALFVLPFAVVFFVWFIFKMLSPDLSEDLPKKDVQPSNVMPVVTKDENQGFLSSFGGRDDSEKAPQLYISTIMKSNGQTLVLFDYVKPDDSSIVLTLQDLKLMKVDFKEVREGLYTFNGQVVTYAPPGQLKNERKKDEK